jgi:two-component system sensor histidine kinase YesM
MSVLRNLQFQLLSGFIAVAALLIALLFYNNNYAMNAVRSQVANANQTSIMTYVSEMDKELEEINNYLYGLVMQDNDVFTFWARRDQDDYYFAKQRLKEKLIIQLEMRRRVGGFFIYSKQRDDLLCYARQSQLVFETEIRKELQKPDPDTSLWYPMTIDGGSYFIRIVKFNNDVYVGAAIEAKQLAGSMPLWDPALKEGINLVDDQWNMVIATGFPASSLQAIQQKTATLDSFQTVDDKLARYSFMVIGKTLRLARFSVIYTIQEKSLLAGLLKYKQLIYVIEGMVLSLFILYLLFLRKLMLKPIQRLARGMLKIKKGNWEFRLPETSLSKEFELLNSTFNEMAAEITRLKEDVFVKQLQAQKARLDLLQSQINPHFFMNSLNIVYSLAGLNETKLVRKLVQHIVDFLRFTMQNNREWITVKQEIDHIRNYLEIHKLRFPRNLTYFIDTEDQLESILIPPLIIQPFVENCIKHGFFQEHRSFHIEIIVRMAEKGGLELTVKDNGNGFSQEQLARWRGSVDLPNKHIGIRNVMERLSIAYNGKALLSFDNAIGGGAVVAIGLPLSSKEAI